MKLLLLTRRNLALLSGALAVSAFLLAGSFPAGDPLPRSKIPRHYEHIRVAMLAYSGTPFTDFENNLLRNSVDLVIPNSAYLERISKVAPQTAQLIYTNT